MAMNKPSPKDQTTPDKSLACRPTSACPAPSTPARGRLEAGAALKLYRSSFAPSWFQPSYSISRFLLSQFPLGRSVKPPSALPTNHQAPPAATRGGSRSPRDSRETPPCHPPCHPPAPRRLTGRLRSTIFVFVVSSWFRAFPHTKTTAGEGQFRRKQPNRRNRCFRSQDMALNNHTLKERTMAEKIQGCRLAKRQVAVTLGGDGQGPWSNLAGY